VVVAVVVVMGGLNANCGKTAEMPLAVLFLVTRFEIFGQTSPLALQS
jgi:hypothetical protein